MSDINTIGVAVKGLIINKGKVLIIKRAKDEKVNPGAWECVGGKLEFGEDLETALVRETKEEVGLAITVEKLLYATAVKTKPNKQAVIIVYLCRSDEDTIILSHEHVEYKWATKTQLKKLLLPEIIKDFEKNNIFSLEELL